MVHIDVAAILQTSVSGMFTDLVTRATGRTVRTRIEEHIAPGDGSTVAVIDFSRVGLLDFSCADEIVATLMRRACADETAAEPYLLFAGITDAHLDAIEHVLERHRLALVVRYSRAGVPRLIGVVSEAERVIWEALVRVQPSGAPEVACEADLDVAVVQVHLDALHRRRLVMHDSTGYRTPIGALA